MSKVFIEESTLTAIGDAIRGKNGTTDMIAPLDMATAIANLPSGGGTLKYAQKTLTTPETFTNSPAFDLSGIVNYDTPFIAYFSHPLSNSGDSRIQNVIAHPIVLYYDGNGNISTLYQYVSNSFSPGYIYKDATFTEDCIFTLNSKSTSGNWYSSVSTSKTFYLHIFYIE